VCIVSGPRSLSKEEVERVRGLLVDLVAEHGNQTKLDEATKAAGLRLSQQSIGRYVKADRPEDPGYYTVRVIARLRGVSEEFIRTGKRAGDEEVPLCLLPGWADAEKQIRLEHVWVGRRALEKVGRSRWPDPPVPLPTGFVFDLAVAVQRNMPTEART